MDIRADTLNLDERLVEDAITSRTRALAPIDYAGVGSEMDVLVQLARGHDLIVIEDAAQGYRASYKGRPLGTKADVACFSFHETKNVMCGEGGALLVNRPEWVERAEVIQEKGTNRSKFFRGQVDKYTWTDIGSSYVVSDISAAFLWAQLEQATEITASRIALWETYHAALEELETAGRLRRPVVPAHCATTLTCTTYSSLMAWIVMRSSSAWPQRASARFSTMFRCIHRPQGFVTVVLTGRSTSLTA